MLSTTFKHTLLYIVLFTLPVVSNSQNDTLNIPDTATYKNLHLENTYIYPSDDVIAMDKIANHGNLQLLSLVQNSNSSLIINNNSGSPGASISAILRGRKSYLNSYSPLIILDGLPIDNSEWNNNLRGTDQSNRLIDINPFDIESMKIIKGSVGAVRYGIRGANGVIILTTKKGTSKTPRIQINSEVTRSSVGQLPARQSTFAQGVGFEGGAKYFGPETRTSFSWGPNINTLEFVADQDYVFDKNGRLVPKGTGNAIPAKAYDPYVFFENAISNNLNANISGTTNSISYYFSAGSNRTNGIIPKSYYIRNAISGSISADLSNKLSVSTSLRYINGSASRNVKGATLNGVMLGLQRNTPTFDITNGLSPSEAVDDSTSYLLPSGEQRSYRAGVYDNPYWSINKNPNTQSNNRFIGSASLQYQITPNLSLRTAGGIDTYSDKHEGGIAINPSTTIGSAYQRIQNYQSSNFDLHANYTKAITPKFNANVLVGVNYFVTDIKNQFEEGIGLRPNMPANVVYTDEATLSKSALHSKNFGVLSSLDLSYSNAIQVTFSLRQDYASTAGSNEKGFLSFGMHSSIDLWKILHQSSNPNELPKLQIFGGYGRSGLAIPSAESRSVFVPTKISGDGFLALEIVENTLEKSEIAGNPDLQHERTDAIEVGIITHLLSDRIHFKSTFYTQNSSDVILPRFIPPSTGFTSIYDNLASISNKGLELSLSLKPIETDNFSWSFTTIFNTNKNKVEEMDVTPYFDNTLSGFNSISSSFVEGEPVGILFGRGFERNDKNQLIINNQGYPVLNQMETVLGDPNPDFILGFENQLTIKKNLSINVRIDIKQGGDLYCGSCQSMDYFGVSQLSADERGQSIVFEGVTENGTINTQSVELANPTRSISEYYRLRYGTTGLIEENIFDASWIRIRRVDINYDLTSIVSKIGFVRSFKVGLYADNLLLVTDFPGIDPETNLSGNSLGFGFEYFNNPSSRTIGVNLNLIF